MNGLDGITGVTLLELLRFYAERYLALTRDMASLAGLIEIGAAQQRQEMEPGVEYIDRPLKPDEEQYAYELLKNVSKRCAEVGLSVCKLHVDELRAKRVLDAGEIGHLSKSLERELATKYFVQLPPNRVRMFTDSREGWHEVATVFSEAMDDIEEMNCCFALCRYAAAVFHSLMVVEHGLVKLGPVIGVTDPKEGWDATCKRLEAVVRAGRSVNQTGLDFNELDQLNVCLQAMKMAWRNKVNHATGKPLVLSGGFSPDVAEEIIATTRGFMRRLATVLAPSRP